MGKVAGGIPRAVVPVTAALVGFFFLITALLRYESHMIKFTLNVYDPRVYCVRTVAQPSPLSFQNVFITPRKTPSHPLPTAPADAPAQASRGSGPPCSACAMSPAAASSSCLLARHALTHFLPSRKFLTAHIASLPVTLPALFGFLLASLCLPWALRWDGRQAGGVCSVSHIWKPVLWPLCPVSERIRWFSAWECPSSERPLERD